ncbi:large subunit ribosomal protein L13Ae [Nematocida sp. AWRm77]|nr:large subunit ribosomal protein L13Ae [Nematocida sp. AWRm77]
MATTGRKLVIDGKGHIVGRLAAHVAKELREGAEVIVVRAEGTVFSSPIDRMLKIYKDKRAKRCLVNPAKGPFHFKEPSRCFKRVVRGMLNYKKTMGGEAFNRLHVFDGIPLEHEMSERMVFPKALAETKLNPTSKRCTLGQVCTKMGWNHAAILQKFEEQRKARIAVVAKEQESKEQQKKEFIASSEFQKLLSEMVEKIE